MKFLEYVQALRTLLDAMQLGSLPKEVHVTIFMKRICTGVARTDIFRVHPLTFEEAAEVALNADFWYAWSCPEFL